MDLIVEPVEGVVVVAVVGDVDLATAPGMEECLSTQLAAGRVRLVLDLSQVAFMGSVGLRVVLSLLQASRQKGGDLRLCAAQPGVAKLLRVAGASEVMRIFATRGEAVGSYVSC